MDFLLHKFKIVKTVNWLDSRLWGLVLLFILLIVLSAFFLINKTKIVVELPVPHSNLHAKQTFRVALTNVKQVEDYSVFWSVDGEILSDQMTWQDGYFESIVDIDNWDWNKDNSYLLEFKAYNQDNVLVDKKSLTVFSGLAYQENAIVSGEAEILKKTLATVNQSFSADKDKAVLVSESVEVKPEVLTIGWIEGPAHGSQNFVFNIKGYLPTDVNAFWQVEGGHKNFIFETDTNGRYVAAINFSGWHWLGNGPYLVSFIITDKNNSNEIAREDLNLTWDNTKPEPKIVIEKKTNSLATQDQVLTLPAYVTPELPKVPISLASLASLPFKSDKLYISHKPAIQESLKNITNPKEANAIRYILNQPSAVWLNGDGHDSDEFLSNIASQVTVDDSLPIFVLYNIPNRDCGSHSAGGADLAGQYKSWINRLTRALAGIEMIVVIEPDALAQLNCLSVDKRAERLELINYAVDSFSNISSAHVYIDAGHPFWVNAEEMADRLKQAGVDKAKGFALNVSNFISTEDNIRYGNYLSNLLEGKKYIIDTSRNGSGPDKNLTWCNPSGRALGQAPSLNNSPNHKALDAFLWIKFPGESDGTCNGGPNAGLWWLEYALNLAKS